MGEETEKGIGKLKIGLSMSLIAIVILALLNSWFYITKQSLELTHNDYMATHSHTDTEYAALQSEYNDYMATHSHNDSEFNALQSEYNDYMATHGYTNDEFWDSSANYTYEHWYHHYYENQTLALKAPKLSALSVYGEDVRELWDKYLHITGEVWNVGTDTAHNS